MRNSENRGLLDEQLKLIDSWDNAEGDFDFDDAFGDDAWGQASGYEEAAGTAGQHNQYTNQRIKRPVSMPYVYTVTSTTNANVFVNMFGAEVNYAGNNFGNVTGISFFYSLSGYYGGGVTGYAALLQRTIAQTFSIGRVRMEAPSNVAQVAVPITISDYDPTGKSTAYPAIQFTKLNQFITYAVETEVDITIYGGTQLTYQHLTGGTTAATVTWYFWAADVASITRALEGKGAFKELRKPDTYLQQTIKMSAPQAKAIGK